MIENKAENISSGNAKIGGWLGAGGAAASWLCAVHCLVLPFFVSVLPLVGLSFLLEETTEQVFIGISILIAVVALVPAYFRQHGKLRAIGLFVAGIGLILVSHLLFEDSLTPKILFLLSGAVLISAAHLVNHRLCRECVRCQPS